MSKRHETAGDGGKGCAAARREPLAHAPRVRGRDPRREAQGIAPAGAGQVSRGNSSDPAGLTLREAVGELSGRFPRALEAQAVRARKVVRGARARGCRGAVALERPGRLHPGNLATKVSRS